MEPVRSLTIVMILTGGVVLPIVYIFSGTGSPVALLPLVSRLPLLPTSRHHLLFSLSSSNSTYAQREAYIRLWYSANTTRAFTFLEQNPSEIEKFHGLPPVVVSQDTSQFPYTPKKGLPSAVRVARVVKEAVRLNQKNVRWFVFGDDDTFFFVGNLVRTLAKYNHEKWYYIGSNSESYGQNQYESFEMAFGGAGFAVSYPLAMVLADVLDSCLLRYGHVYGGDARIYSCLAELGVGLTHEPGFHQVDMRGNLFGMLSSHPLPPIVSLHHLDYADPIFPNRTRVGSVQHLLEAARVDPARVFQQTVCYNRNPLLTVSISWGYSVQIYEGNKPIPDLLSAQKSFKPWRKSKFDRYMFNVREYAAGSCQGSSVFLFETIKSGIDEVITSYSPPLGGTSCNKDKTFGTVKRVLVFTQKQGHEIDQVCNVTEVRWQRWYCTNLLFVLRMKTLRRQCCDILSLNSDSITLSIRKCGTHELIAMLS